MAGQHFRCHCVFFTKIYVFALFIVLGSGFSYARGMLTEVTGPSQIQVIRFLAEAEKTMSEGRYEEALKLSSQTYSLARSANDVEGMLGSLIQQGLLYWNLGRMKESSEAFARAQELAVLARVK